MKILIVNGYRPSVVNRQRFSIFCKIVKEAFKKHKSKCSGSIEFVIEDSNKIDEYLYEAFSKYTGEESRKRFDSLDMVFLDGEANHLPWSPK